MWSSSRRWAGLCGTVACLWSSAAGAKDVAVRVDTVGVPPLATATVEALPRTIAVTRDESYAYIANFNADTLSILDLTSLEVIGGMDVTDGPAALAISPDNTLLWVANFYSDDVWVINIVTDTVESRIPVAEGPLAIALSPDGKTAYVAAAFSGAVSVIDEATRETTGTVFLGRYPQTLAMSPDGGVLYVGHGVIGEVEAVDLASGQTIARAQVGGDPQGLLALGGRVAVAPAGGTGLVVLDGQTLARVRDVPVARGPRSFAPGPSHDEVYVLSEAGRTLTLCNLADGTVMPQRLAEGRYLAVAVAPKRGRMLISRTAPDEIHVWGVASAGGLVERAAVPVAEPEPERKPTPETRAADVPQSAGQTNAPLPGLPVVEAEDLDVVKDVALATGPPELPAVDAVEARGYPDADVEAAPVSDASAPEGRAATTPLVDAVAEPGPAAPSMPDNGTAGASESGGAAPAVPDSRPVVDAPATVAAAEPPRGSAGDVPPPVRPQPAAHHPPGPVPGPGYGAEEEGSLLARVQRPLARLRAPVDRLLRRGDPAVEAAVALPRGEAMVVVNVSGRSLSVLDLRQGGVTVEIGLDDQPRGVATSADGQWIYVAQPHARTVSVISRTGHDPRRDWPVEQPPSALAVSGDGRRLCVVLADVNQVAVLDAQGGRTLSTVPTGDWPSAVVVNRAGTRAYVADQHENTVSVLDLDAGTRVASWRVGESPSALALTPDDATLAVACAIEDSLHLVDTATGAARAVVAVGDRPQSLALSSDGMVAYVGNFLGSSVTQVNVGTGEVLATYETSRHPSGLAVGSSGEYLYVANRFANAISVLRLPSGQAVSTLDVGVGPASLHPLAALAGP